MLRLKAAPFFCGRVRAGTHKVMNRTTKPGPNAASERSEATPRQPRVGDELCDKRGAAKTSPKAPLIDPGQRTSHLWRLIIGVMCRAFRPVR